MSTLSQPYPTVNPHPPNGDALTVARQLTAALWAGGDWAFVWTPNTGEHYTDPHTGQERDIIERDFDRDIYFDPESAVEYGLIDSVVERAE